MRQTHLRLPLLTAAGAVVSLLSVSLLSIPAWAVPFTATNLVTDDEVAHPAQITDPGLKNAWGIAFSPTGEFWVSSTGAGTSPVYSVDPATQATIKLPLTVAIPGDGSVTGQVFNGSTSFNNNRFLFVSEDGTVSGFRPELGTTGVRPAETIVPALPENNYKGAAIGSVWGYDYLYAANFKAGAIDVYKGTLAAPALTGSFTDPGLPAGYAPYNVQNLNDSLYVTYALQDAAKTDEVPGVGLGYVDKFNLNGDFVERVASGGTLNAPWGLAIAPSSFGPVAGELLVGNFGDGRISIYDADTHAYLGQVLDSNSEALSIDGLWAISAGNDGLAGSSQLLYFAAGPDEETRGLFGVLTPVPEPSAYAMMLVGLGVLTLLVRSSRKLAQTETFDGSPA